MAKKYVAYYRVSTDRQGASGLGLEAQKAVVEAFAKQGEILASFTEIESGKGSAYRPNLIAALDLCKSSGATLLIAKLDRLARNLKFVVDLMESKVEFICCDMPAANQLTIQILAAVAQNERDMISARTRAALQAAKVRGVKLGAKNPSLAAKRAGIVAADKADALAIRLRPEIARCQKAGFRTFREIAECLSARGVKTSQGTTEWSASSVRNAMIRSGMIAQGGANA